MTWLLDIDSQLVHYVIVRRDLPLGFLAAQVVHAAGESSASSGLLPSSLNAVVLAVTGEAALVRVHDRLTKANIPCHLIREPDAPWCGEATAIGLVPGLREQLRKHLSDLPLLRGDVVQSRTPANAGDGGSRPSVPTTPNNAEDNDHASLRG